MKQVWQGSKVWCSLLFPLLSFFFSRSEKGVRGNGAKEWMRGTLGHPYQKGVEGWVGGVGAHSIYPLCFHGIARALRTHTAPPSFYVGRHFRGRLHPRLHRQVLVGLAHQREDRGGTGREVRQPGGAAGRDQVRDIELLTIFAKIW